MKENNWHMVSRAFLNPFSIEYKLFKDNLTPLSKQTEAYKNNLRLVEARIKKK